MSIAELIAIRKRQDRQMRTPAWHARSIEQNRYVDSVLENYRLRMESNEKANELSS